MPAFQNLDVAEVQALTDYVKYLTIRGQLERKLLSEVDSMDGDPLIDFELANDPSGDGKEEFQEQFGNHKSMSF